MNSFNRFAYQMLLRFGAYNILTASMLVGMTIGIALQGYLGYLIGSALGHPTTGLYCGFALYCTFFAYNLEALQSNLQARAEIIESMINR